MSGRRGPGTEGAEHIPPPIMLATTPEKRSGKRYRVQRHTQRPERQKKRKKQARGRWDQTGRSAAPEQSRAAGAGVEPGWG